MELLFGILIFFMLVGIVSNQYSIIRRQARMEKTLLEIKNVLAPSSSETKKP